MKEKDEFDKEIKKMFILNLIAYAIIFGITAIIYCAIVAAILFVINKFNL